MMTATDHHISDDFIDVDTNGFRIEGQSRNSVNLLPRQVTVTHK